MQKKLNRMIHISIIVIVLVILAFIAIVLIFKYGGKDETKVPFNISKVTIISTTDANDVDNSDSLWEVTVNQNNDIYIDIEKNENYEKTCIIDKVVLNNFQITKKSDLGEVSIYKPSNTELWAFKNSDEYKVNELTFNGGESTNIQNLQISNQGGRIAFRCANINIGTYKSNEDLELDYGNLLGKLNLTNEDLEINVSFDIEIFLTFGKSFKSNMELKVPTGDVIQKGKTSKEITDCNIILKKQ